MTKTYQIKINQGKDSKALDIPQAGTKGQAVTVKAVSGARYQLIDPETGYGPENIRASRQGKDLKVSFEGSNTTDLVIEDYYKVSPDGYNGLIGEAESGKFYEYIPENAAGMASVPMLADAGQVVGMALGGMEVAPAGAAVGVLAAGLFSPWLLGAGALGVAAAGGGGGGTAATTDTTAPTGQTGALAPVVGSDSATLGDNKTNVTKPTITGKAEAGSTVEVSFVDPAGKVTGPYKTKAVANGNYSLVVPDNLADNAVATDTKGTQYTPVIRTTDAAGNSSTANGTPFVVDTKAVAVLSLTINADGNNDGYITTAEKGTETTSSVTAQLDNAKVVAGDVLTFSDGTTSQSVTLKDSDITSGQVTTSGWKIPGQGVAMTISAVLMDLAGNVSVAVKDMVTTVIESLKTALTINPISSDNIISVTEGVATEVIVTGQVTGSYAAQDSVALELNGTTYTAQVGADGGYSIKVSMKDIKADVDSLIEAKVTGTNGSTATAAQNYAVELQSTAGQTTGLFIDSITTDNILNLSETSVDSLVVTGKATGKFSEGDKVFLNVNGNSYVGLVELTGLFKTTVKISDLLADIDTIINATITGTGGTSAKALQDYGIDTIAAKNLALSIDLDKVIDGSSYGNDGFINSTEKDKATTTGLTASFDPKSVSVGDVVTFSFSDGTSSRTVVLDKDMVANGTVTVSGSGKEWALPGEAGTLNVKVKISDAAGNSSEATDSAIVDTTAMAFNAAVLTDVGQSVFTKATFGHGLLENGTYKMHVGTTIFEGSVNLNQGFTRALSSSLYDVIGSEIYLEVWDAAGNYTKAAIPDQQQTNHWNLAIGTQFIV